LKNQLIDCDDMIDWNMAVFINQTSIGEYATVGAGAVVTKPIPRHCVAVGVPARVVKVRETNA